MTACNHDWFIGTGGIQCVKCGVFDSKEMRLQERIDAALAIAEKAYAAGDLAGAVTPMVLALKGEGE